MDTSLISGKFPDKIRDYIKQKFGAAFIYEPEDTKDSEGNIFYKVEINQDDLFYLLKFDSNGNLLERKIKPVYISSSFNQPYYETEGFYEGTF